MMKRLQDRLLKQQARFVRKVRRVILVASVAIVCLLGLALWNGFARPRAGGGVAVALDDGEPDGPVSAVDEGEEHPGQLAPAGWLQVHAPEGVVRRTGSEALKISLVDPGVIIALLETVAKHTQADLSALADDTIGWDDFADKESRRRIRGRVCRFRGTLRRWLENDSLDLSDAAPAHLYEGQIQDGQGRWCSFFCFEEPDHEISDTDVAELVGVFYGLIKFPTRGGQEQVTPLIVARTIASSPRPAAGPPLTWRLVAGIPVWARCAGGAAIVALVCAAGSLLLRRRPAPRNGQDHRRGGES